LILQELLYGVQTISITGNASIVVSSLSIDSRVVAPSSCFIAIVGSVANGNTFISTAIANGATVIVTDDDTIKHETATVVLVKIAGIAAGIIAHNFYGKPSEQLKIVGVTGTNGKTTVATMLYNLFTSLGYTCGLLSTVQNKIAGTVVEATHTTPNAIALNALLQQMQQAGCTHVFMECSSHAIHQHRIAGLQFTGAIFTNITHDHLDYHKTFDEYIQVKKSWFDDLPKTAFAISNADDKRGAVMLQNTSAKKMYYSLRTVAEFKGKILHNSISGLHMLVNDVEVYFKVIGEFNAYNLLAVYGAAIQLHKDKAEVLLALSNTNTAEGRFDYVVSNKENVMGIVDYAHTPDALLNVLVTIKKLKQGHEKLIAVVGCGGDRDKTKRPLMAQVACQHSDKVIFTSDNPRTENADAIIKDMEAGVDVVARRKYISVVDRKEAIKTAVSLAGKEDIVLVAGKGHEKYQEVSGVRHAFDDKKVLQEVFELLDK
jgi:UDP-N-acetylmuramoyl-L-alanyl-D-glutamate--2,6-diaminopimelate ligase